MFLYESCTQQLTDFQGIKQAATPQSWYKPTEIEHLMTM